MAAVFIANYDSSSTFLEDYRTQAAREPKCRLPVVVKTQKKTRRSHQKSRGGCLTCKVRRKKCDETKPACILCSSTGRKCDGYPTTAESAASLEHLPLNPATTREADSSDVHSDSGYGTPTDLSVADEDQIAQFISAFAAEPDERSDLSELTAIPQHRTRTALGMIPRPPSMFPDHHMYSDVDSHCFSYFRHRTGPQFASYFESSIWRNRVIPGALTHPVLFDAAAAVGAVHRRFEYGISREAFEYCAHAARLYARSLRGLRELKARLADPSSCSDRSGPLRSHDCDVVITTETLLGLFEGFQGNYSNSVKHLETALHTLLSRPMTLTYRESRYYEVRATPAMFQRLFDRISRRMSRLFGTPTRILAKADDGDELPPVPSSFTSLEEARDFLYTEVDWMLRASSRVWTVQVSRGHVQNIHVNGLLRWSVAYADLVINMQRTRLQSHACKLLKMTRNVAYLLLYMTLSVAVGTHALAVGDPLPGTEQQSLWDLIARREDVNINLARCHLLVDEIIDEESAFSYDQHSLSLDTAIGPPQRFDNLPGSSNKTRHRVRAMHENGLDDSSLWEMLGVYGIAESISAIEEHAVIPSMKNMISASTDVKWVDLSFILEERRILLRYCTADSEGLGLKWVQEWWKF